MEKGGRMEIWGGGRGVLLRLKAGDVIYLIQLTLVPFIVN